MENENKHPEPNYKLIAKYLKLANYDNYRYNLEIFRNDYIKNNCVDFEEFIKQFNLLIEKYNLINDNGYDFLYFISQIYLNWHFSNSMLSEHGKPDVFEHSNLDFDALCGFLDRIKPEPKEVKIKITTNNDAITLTSQDLSIKILRLINEFSKTHKKYNTPYLYDYETYLVEYEKRNELDRNRPLKEGYERVILPPLSKKEFTAVKKSFSRKQSYIKNYTQNLKPFFRYLKNETHFKDKTNTEIYNFIIEFTELIGIEWHEISVMPDEYLKDTFKNTSL